MADEISTRVALTGEKEYRDELKAIADAQKTLSSETAKATAAFDRNDKSVEALAVRNGQLEKKLELQKQKVEACRKGLENANKAWGEADSRTKKWQKDLNYAEASVIKTEKAIRSNTDAISEMNRVAESKALKNFAEGAKAAGDRLNSAGNKLTVGLTAPLAAAGVASVNYASNTSEALNKVEVAFGSAADSVESWSKTTLESYGLAQGTSMDMAALYGDMATSMGFSQEAAADMSKTLVGLGGDLASFKNISIDVANTALKSIFTGETESLKGLGVVMTQANLKAFALAQGYKTAYAEMDQAQQVQVRYQYVLAKTSNAQGDFTRTSGGTANQLRILQESLKEAAATAGNDLLPVVTPIITNLSNMAKGFGDLDEGTRKAIVQTGLFLATLGPALKLTGGLTTAISAGTAAYQALTAAKAVNTTATAAQTAATASATAAQTGLNAAMAASPIGAVITAVGALVAVLGSFALTTALTSKKQEDLSKQIRESKEEYEKTTNALQAEQTSTLGTISAIEKLSSVTGKTTAQKATLKKMVDQLNESVPNLSLAYNEQADSLNMTTEAIRKLAKAEANRKAQEAIVGRLTTLYQTQADIQQKAEEAAINLTDAQQRLAEAQESSGEGVEDGAYLITGYQMAVNTAQSAVEDLSNKLSENQSEIEEETRKADRLSAALNRTENATKDTSFQLDSAASSASDASTAFDSLSEILSTLQGGYELLSKAQKEMQQTGYLSLSTLSSLIEKYPQLTKYIEETADGYKLTDGAIQDYLMSQRAAYTLAEDKADAAAQSMVAAEADKLRAINATTLGIEDQLKALAALYQSEAIKENISNNLRNPSISNPMNAIFGADPYNKAGVDTTTAGRKAQEINRILQDLESSRNRSTDYDRVAASLQRDSASKSTSSKSAGKTPAEKELEAYQEAVKELDHLRAMDKISEEDYYKEKAALGDRYLKNSKEERQKLDEELYTYQKKQQEKQKQLKKAAYEDALADAKYFRDMEIYSDQQYYTSLAKLRDQYLAENSDEWRRVTVELHQWVESQREAQLEAEKKAHEEQLDALKEAYDKRLEAAKDAYGDQKDAAKEAYEDKKRQIQAELDLEKVRLNTIIDGIDKEIQARKELREDEDQDGKIAEARKRLEAAQAQLTYARTDEDKAQWQKEIVRLQAALDAAVQDKEDTAFYRRKEAEKEAVQDKITAAEKAASADMDDAELSYQAKLRALEENYEAKLARLQEQYEAKAAGAESRPVSTVSTGGGNNVLASTVAGVVGAAAAGLAHAVNNTVQNVVKNSKASVTINQASSLTEGQIARTVKKVLDQLDR